MKALTFRQKQAINTKFNIAKKAMELFKIHGYESVKISDICEAAQVSVGTFYYYFKNKEEIIENSYKQIDSILQERVEIKVYSTSCDKIIEIFTQAAIILEELGWKFVSDAYKQIISSNSKYTLSQTRYPYAATKLAIETAISNNELPKNTDITELTELCMKTSRGLIFDWCLFDGSYSLKNKVKKNIEWILKSWKCINCLL